MPNLAALNDFSGELQQDSLVRRLAFFHAFLSSFPFAAAMSLPIRRGLKIREL